ncbi:TetR/AcrR family transcriptional regulator [Pseudonocardia ailaonensis]|uniref:TetR/AcrR family transcriptional regulator n=1 Tax=Pseudonocardia ailaonensis TaxID=367279 RepID=UPI0031D23913
MSAPREARRPGRRSGDSGTREAILTAARGQFAAHGFRGASLRTIAGEAGVDPALIRHFFGSKDDLFDATLEVPHQLVERIKAELAGEPEGLGERLTRTYLGLWEDPATSGPLLALMRSAVTSEPAAERLRAMLGRRLFAEVPALLGRSDGEVRAALIGAHLVGVALARHVVRLPPVAELDLDTLVSYCAPAIGRYLTEPLGAP